MDVSDTVLETLSDDGPLEVRSREEHVRDRESFCRFCFCCMVILLRYGVQFFLFVLLCGG